MYLHHHGGYYVSYPILRFQVRLHDEATGKVAWTASAITRGHQSTDPHDFSESLASTLVDRLIVDGVPPTETATEP